MSTITLAAASCRPAAPVRLTPRGRLAVVVLALVAAFVVMASVGRPVVSAATGETARPALRTVVVDPGQTLWQIATTVAPGVDPRDTVIRLERLNGLDGPMLRAGQQLVVPAAG